MNDNDDALGPCPICRKVRWRQRKGDYGNLRTCGNCGTGVLLGYDDSVSKEYKRRK